MRGASPFSLAYLRCALGLSLALAPSLASAEVLDFAPEGAQLALVFRGAETPADLLDGLERRFGEVPAIKEAAARLRALEYGQVAPFSRRFRPGLALGRGGGLFVQDERAVRLVVGTDDEKAALDTVVELGTAAGIPITRTATGFGLEALSFTCATQDGYLLCDTAAPTKAGRPAWTKSAPVPTDGLALLMMRGPLMAQAFNAGPVQTVWMSLTKDALRLELGFNPLMMGPAAPFIAQGAPLVGLETVDRSTQSLALISLDGPKILDSIKHQLGILPPNLEPLFAAVHEGWTGDLVLSFAGSLSHPLLSLGLRNPEAGRPILEALVALLQAANTPTELSKDGTLSLAIPEAKLKLNLATGVVGKSLLLAFSPQDIKRVADGRVSPFTLRAGMNERGRVGLVFKDPLSWLEPLVPIELLQGEGATQLMLDGQLLGGLLLSLIDELGASARLRSDGLSAELWWSVL